MEIVIFIVSKQGAEVRLHIDPQYGAARHLDGLALWRKTPGFEHFEDLSPSSDDGPYAPGGIVYCHAFQVSPDESIETVAVRVFSHRVPSSDIKYGRWNATNLPEASISWTDGVSDVLSLLLRLAPGVHLIIEYSVLSRRDESWTGPRPYHDPLSLLRAILHMEVVAEPDSQGRR